MQLIHKVGLVIILPLIVYLSILLYINMAMSNEAIYKVAAEQNMVITEETLGPLFESSQKVALLSMMLLVIFAIVIIFLLTRLLKPISFLMQTTRAIAAGDITQRVKVTSEDEIGELAISFNTMADKLQELYSRLEEKVSEKTAELGLKIREIQQAKAKDEAILMSIGQGIIVVDNNNYVILINDATKEILGIDETIIGRAYQDVIIAKDVNGMVIPDEKTPIYEAIRSGHRVQITALNKNTFYLVRANGTMCPVALTCTPIIVDGAINGAIIIFQDITRDKEVDRMKTEFISLASHQLRTPLSAIRWFTEMLLAGDAGTLTPEQTEFAQNINDSTRRMIQLVNGLLNISRIESGRIIVDPHPTNLVELVKTLLEELRSSYEGKQQKVILSAHEQLPLISIDPKLIRQVYLNLLTNAIKYTQKEGEINVFISRKNDYIISQVTDNGLGIPVDQQEKIFQKFYRAENAVKIETDGNGLGLYLAKSIVESSGGRIWFKSDEGKGTTIWFSLPISGTPPKKGEVSLD